MRVTGVFTGTVTALRRLAASVLIPSLLLLHSVCVCATVGGSATGAVAQPRQAAPMYCHRGDGGTRDSGMPSKHVPACPHCDGLGFVAWSANESSAAVTVPTAIAVLPLIDRPRVVGRIDTVLWQRRDGVAVASPRALLRRKCVLNL